MSTINIKLKIEYKWILLRNFKQYKTAALIVAVDPYARSIQIATFTTDAA